MDASLQQLLGAAGGGGQGAAGADQPTPDTSEQIHISSLALLKMLKHGKYICNFYEIIKILISASAAKLQPIWG